MSVLGTHRSILVALAVVLGALGAARAAGPGETATVVAVAMLFGVPVAATRVGGRAGVVFALVSAVMAVMVVTDVETYQLPVVLMRRFAYFAIPPLALSLALAEADRERLKLGPLHLYGPAAVMAVGVVAHLALRRGTADTGEGEIRTAAAVYGLCYLALMAVALRMRMHAHVKAAPAPVPDALVLEESGRYGMASRAYEREGQLEQAAHAAERAGDWARAGRLFQRCGDDFNAAEMYFRARLLPEALDAYERNRAWPAAARLAVQLGQVDRAVALLEKTGDQAAVVATLEQAGRRPGGEQYRKAGRLEDAARAFEAEGQLARAADLYENELQDRGRAAGLHLQTGSFLHAARLLEQEGRLQEALEAYAAVPEGMIDAARLCLSAGRPEQAAELVGRLSPAQVEAIEDDATLTTIAKVLVKTGRLDEAIRILQGLKRRGSAAGGVQFLLGCALLKKGYHDLAQDELRAALTFPLEPAEEMRASYLLGCLLQSSGRRAEAMEIFHALLQKDLLYADVQERYRRLREGSGTPSTPDPVTTP